MNVALVPCIALAVVLLAALPPQAAFGDVDPTFIFCAPPASGRQWVSY